MKYAHAYIFLLIWFTQLPTVTPYIDYIAFQQKCFLDFHSAQLITTSKSQVAHPSGRRDPLSSFNLPNAGLLNSALGFSWACLEMHLRLKCLCCCILCSMLVGINAHQAEFIFTLQKCICSLLKCRKLKFKSFKIIQINSTNKPFMLRSVA